MEEAKALYLYCLARADLSAAALEGTGIGGQEPLFLLRHGRISAVLSEVRLDDFTGAEADARLKELAWLTPRVLRHEEIIERVLAFSPVLPMRFATIFSAPERLKRVLAANHDAIAAFLERTAGTGEWAIKLYLDRGPAKDAWLEASLAAQPKLSASPGTRYLQERRLRAAADGALQQWLDDACRRLFDDLSVHARQSTERKTLPSGPPDSPGEMVANWAFLVHQDALARFRTAAGDASRALSDRHLAVELTGPFPPFSFAPTLAEPGEAPEEGVRR